MEDLKSRTVRGGFAKVCSQAANLALRLGSLMILASLLDPRDFGLVAMVTVLTGVLNLFRDFGLSTATVQRRSVSNEQLSTLFWINLFMGVLLACLAVGSAALLADFYHEPRLRWITVALAAGFSSTPPECSSRPCCSARCGSRRSPRSTRFHCSSASLWESEPRTYGFGYWALVGNDIDRAFGL